MMSFEIKPVPINELLEWSDCLLDHNKSLVERSRALWGLRHASEPDAIDLLGKFLINVTEKAHPAANDLLQHEAAYCLGQKGDYRAINILKNVLNDKKHSVIVRHEAAEALAALAGRTNININEIESYLKDHEESEHVEIAETCQIGLNRINYIRALPKHLLSDDFFNGIVDPANSLAKEITQNPQELRNIIMNIDNTLYYRYEALFALRNLISSLKSQPKNCDEAARILSSSLTAPGSALLRHEIAFVLGELSLPVTTEDLCKCICDRSEHPIVRHEAAEALGSVLGNSKIEKNENLVLQAEECLSNHIKDKVKLVRESCVLALDVADYISSDDFNYCTMPSTH